MNILSSFPNKETLLAAYKQNRDGASLKVNGHIHSPFSFSAFRDIKQAVKLAKSENISILGINDFFVTDGYQEFAKQCYASKIFPLFNIEFIGLDKNDQLNGLKINDPGNPGRIYLSGKGLNFPAMQSKKQIEKLDNSIDASQDQIELMIEKLNALIAQAGFSFSFSIDEIREGYAEFLVRERHIAKALRELAIESFETVDEQISFFTKLYGSAPKVAITDAPGFENEIRSRLLKAGGAAFVPEDDSAFLSVAELREVIIDAGGIPTYPLLLDDANGCFTDFESDKEALLEQLKSKGIYSIEFIPSRNTLAQLEIYSEFFFRNGFLVTYGTEHNTPKLEPLTVSCGNNVPLSEKLMQICYESSAVIAAHQYLKTKGEDGYLNTFGVARQSEMASFIELGKAVIQKYLEI